MRVLVIDPIKSESADFCKLIKQSGHEAVPAPSAKEAFQLIRKDPFDAVVASKMIIDIPSNIIGMLFKQSGKASNLPFFEVDSFKKDGDSIIEFIKTLKTGEAQNGSGEN